MNNCEITSPTKNQTGSGEVIKGFERKEAVLSAASYLRSLQDAFRLMMC